MYECIKVSERVQTYTYPTMNIMVEQALSSGHFNEKTAAEALKNTAPVNIDMTNAELCYDLVRYSHGNRSELSESNLKLLRDNGLLDSATTKVIEIYTRVNGR